MRLAPPEIKYILDDSQTRVLLVGRDFYPVVEQLEGQLETVGTIVALDGGHPRWPDYAAWRDAQSSEDPRLDVRMVRGTDPVPVVFDSPHSGRDYPDDVGEYDVQVGFGWTNGVALALQQAFEENGETPLPGQARATN